MTSGAKPWWSLSRSKAPTEVVSEAPRKGPPSPETEVAFATVRLEAAMDEKAAPGNREQLLDLARHGYLRALKQDPKNKEALLGLARFHARLGERDKALEVFQKYLQLYPQDRDVVHEVALIHARWKDWGEAVAWCDRALKLDPDNLTFKKTMAFCLARGGKWEDAYMVFCQFMPEAHARYNIARVMEHQNYPEATRQQLMLALKADPNFADAREFLAEMDQAPQQQGLPDPNAIQRASYVPGQ
jgi:tetratricopeptide (TPR) repeat protein